MLPLFAICGIFVPAECSLAFSQIWMIHYSKFVLRDSCIGMYNKNATKQPLMLVYFEFSLHQLSNHQIKKIIRRYWAPEVLKRVSLTLQQHNNIATSTCFRSHVYCLLIDEAKHCSVCEHVAGGYIHGLPSSSFRCVKDTK